jgi:3',5'-cyclic AMP phosphodiesterase CpdA
VSLIAHLSDVHLLAPGEPVHVPMRLASTGRVVDALGRMEKLRGALAEAKRASATHYVFSGDLTEFGTEKQFETFAELLSDAGLTGDQVTLIPGNHDAYTSASGWQRAIAGPLQTWAAGAAAEGGKVQEIARAFVLPVDVSRHQNVIWSQGYVTEEVGAALARRLADPALAREAVLLVVHHPPFKHDNPGWHWLNGLRDQHRVLSLLERYPHAHVLHGHLHRRIERPVGDVARARVFCVPAVVNVSGARVRFYEVSDGVMREVG